MTQHMPKWRSRIFHVPHGTPYMVENSYFGLKLAERLGYRWIDVDCHVTQDGVPVIGHWGKIKKDKFVLPAWFVKKYGTNPDISDALWEDLARLRTRRVFSNGFRRKFHYITLRRAAHIAARTNKLGLAVELKSDKSFEQKGTLQRILDDINAAGLPTNRAMIMTLTNSRGYAKRLKAAKAVGFVTVAQARGPIPQSEEPFIDYVRGRWVRSQST